MKKLNSPSGVDEEAQFSGGDERAHARSGDPVTSHEAAASVTKITEKQRAVQTLFRLVGPMHDEQLVPTYHDWSARSPERFPPQTDSGIRSRRSELHHKGFLVKTGRKTRTKANRRADIYEAWSPPPGPTPVLDLGPDDPPPAPRFTVPLPPPSTGPRVARETGIGGGTRQIPAQMSLLDG